MTSSAIPTENSGTTKDGEHYLIKGKVFETMEEASVFFEDYRKATGVFLCIEKTRRMATHRHKSDQEGRQKR